MSVPNKCPKSGFTYSIKLLNVCRCALLCVYIWNYETFCATQKKLVIAVLPSLGREHYTTNITSTSHSSAWQLTVPPSALGRIWKRRLAGAQWIYFVCSVLCAIIELRYNWVWTLKLLLVYSISVYVFGKRKSQNCYFLDYLSRGDEFKWLTCGALEQI